MLHDIVGLIQLAESLAKSAQLPPRDLKLMTRATAQAAQEVAAALRVQQFTARPHKPQARTNARAWRDAQSRRQKQTERAIAKRAEPLYRTLDAAFAEAGRTADAECDGILLRLDEMLSPACRAAIVKLLAGSPHALLRNRIERPATMTQDGWRGMWRLAAPAILQDLRRARQAQIDGDNAKAAQPVVLLTGWHDIAAALNQSSSEAVQKKIKRANKKFNGPIVIGRGSPRVNRAELLEWWNHLAEKHHDTASQK
jgi:hypothetical protein